MPSLNCCSIPPNAGVLTQLEPHWKFINLGCILPKKLRPRFYSILNASGLLPSLLLPPPIVFAISYSLPHYLSTRMDYGSGSFLQVRRIKEKKSANHYPALPMRAPPCPSTRSPALPTQSLRNDQSGDIGLSSPPNAREASLLHSKTGANPLPLS